MSLLVTMGLGPTGPLVVPDTSPPLVVLVSPPADTTIPPSQLITVDVTDAGGGLRRVLMWARWTFLEAQEPVYDLGGFTPPYITSSTRTPITDGFRYVLMRNGGWPEAPIITVDAIDTAGNEDA